jgi:GST-like protein
MIKLFAHPSLSVLKVQIALEEMDLEYTQINDRTLIEGTADYEQFYKASPTGQVPALFDSDTGAALFESAAILMYLAEKTGRFLPPQDHPAKRAEVIKWLMFEATGLTPAMLDIYHYTLQAEDDHPYAEKFARTRVRRALEALQGALGVSGRDFLAGEYSIADMILYPWMPIMEEFADIPPGDYPRLQAWAERVSARAAVKRAEGE